MTKLAGSQHATVLQLPASPIGGITVLGMLALIGLVLLSNFPGPTQGSADKSEAPPEDVSKAKP